MRTSPASPRTSTWSSQLKQASDIKTVTLSQLGGTGGSFKLLTNDQPTLDGAKDIGTGSFTGPSITLPAPQGTKAPYVIISFTQLPKQQSFQTYPYAARSRKSASSNRSSPGSLLM